MTLHLKANLLAMLFCSGMVFPGPLACGSDTADGTSEPTSDNQTDAGADASPNPDPDATPEEGAFEVGTNTVNQNTRESYTPMTEGAEVPLNFGVQGSWMVVLAFRTNNLIEGEFDIRADISIDGVESGSIWLEFQQTFPGGDGWDYYFNLFLALTVDDPPARGTPATISVTVEDEFGTVAEEVTNVLIGEAIP